MILRLALRNLFAHRAKSLVIGTLVFIGVLVSFLGNTVLEDVSVNLERAFTENFTGEGLIRFKGQLSGVFGASGEGSEGAGVPILKPLPHHAEVVAWLRQRPEVERVTSIYVGYASPSLGEFVTDFLLLWGIEPESYFAAFPGVKVLEGRALRPGERGLMLHRRMRQALEENYQVALGPGQSLQVNNMGALGFRIRTLPIVGIFEFSGGNDRFFIPNLIDLESARALFDRPSAAELAVNLPAEATALLGDLSLESLFGEEVIGRALSPSGPGTEGATPAVREDGETEGSFTHVLIRLRSGEKVQEFFKLFDRTAEERRWELQAQGWFESAQPDSMLALGLRLLLNVVALLITIVTVVVIMNTLVASIMERTTEIGTMRALGGRKGFIARLLFWETLMVCAVGGLGALLVGLGVLAMLAVLGIPAPHSSLVTFLGGDVYRPSIQPGAILGAIILVIQTVIFSWLFPVFTALKIGPLKAMSTEY